MNLFETIPVLLLACWKTLDRNDPSTATIIDTHLELVKGKYENSELESSKLKIILKFKFGLGIV